MHVACDKAIPDFNIFRIQYLIDRFKYIKPVFRFQILENMLDWGIYR